MSMPWQLAQAKRRHRRSEPRPLVELLPKIEIADLCRFNVFPSQYETDAQYPLEMPFRYPFVKHLLISLQNIEFIHHSGYNQAIGLAWLRTGLGGWERPRPLFVCNCGRRVTKLYFRYGSLKCRRCHHAVDASQVCDKRTRPILQARRLHNFLRFKSYMSKANRERIKSRLAKAPIKDLKGKRLSHHSIVLPIGNHNTKGAMHWR